MPLPSFGQLKKGKEEKGISFDLPSSEKMQEQREEHDAENRIARRIRPNQPFISPSASFVKRDIEHRVRENVREIREKQEEAAEKKESELELDFDISLPGETAGAMQTTTPRETTRRTGREVKETFSFLKSLGTGIVGIAKDVGTEVKYGGRAHTSIDDFADSLRDVGIPRAKVASLETGARTLRFVGDKGEAIANTFNLPGRFAEFITGGDVKKEDWDTELFDEVAETKAQDMEDKADKIRKKVNEFEQLQLLFEGIDDRPLKEKVEDPEWIAETTGANITNTGISLAAGIAAGSTLGPVAGFATASAVGGGLEAGYSVMEAKDFLENHPDENIRNLADDDEFLNDIARSVGALNGMLEAIPVTAWLNDVPGGRILRKKISSEVLQEIYTRFGQTALQTLEEIPTEMIQEIVANKAAQVYDENRSLTQGVGEAGVAALFTAGGTGTVTGAVQATKDTVKNLPIGLSIENLDTGDTFEYDEGAVNELVGRDGEPVMYEAVDNEGNQVGQFETREEAERSLDIVREIRGEEVEDREVTELFFDTVNELQQLEEGADIDNPDGRVPVAQTRESIANVFGVSPEVTQSRRGLKHVVNRRKGKDKRVINEMPEIVSNPTDVIANYSMQKEEFKPNSYLFVRTNGTAEVVVVEVNMEKNRFEVVTSFLKRKDQIGDIKKAILDVGGAALRTNDEVSLIVSPAESERVAASLSALQRQELPSSEDIVTKQDEDVKEVEEEIKGGPTPQELDVEGRATRQAEFVGRKRETTQLKNRLQQFSRGVREGRIDIRNEQEQTMKEFEETLKEMGLPKRNVNEFLPALRNIITAPKPQEKFIQEFPDLQRRVEKKVEAQKVRNLKEKVDRELKKKVKVDRKRAEDKGKVTIEAQETLEQIKQDLALTQDEAKQKASELIEKMGTEVDPNQDIIFRLGVLEASAGDANAVAWQNLLDDIRSIREEGLTQKELERQNRMAEEQLQRDQWRDSITGGEGLEAGTGMVDVELPADDTAVGANVKRGLASASDRALQTEFLLDKIERANTQQGYLDGPITTFYREGVTEAESKRFQSEEAARKELNEMMIDLWNADEPQNFTQRILARTEIGQRRVTKTNLRKSLVSALQDKIDLGTFKDAQGKEFHMEFTKGQLMYHWGQLQNPVGRATYKETIGWTNEMIAAINDNLTSKEKNFVRKLGQGDNSFFGRYRAGNIDGLPADPIYEDIYGTPLGRVLGIYIPMNRDVDMPAHLQMLDDKFSRVSTEASAIKSRTKNKQPIDLSSDIFKTTFRHITEMSHWKAYAQFLKKFRRLFTGDVRTAIKQNFRDASTILDIVDSQVNDLAADRVEEAKTIEWLDNLMASAYTGFIGANPVSAFKQLASTWAWLGEMDLSRFLSDYPNFWKNPVQKTRFLFENSAGLRQRFDRASFEREAQEAVESGNAERLASTERSFLKEVMILTRVGDMAGILPGMWAKYMDVLEQQTGETAPRDVEALNEFIQENQEAHEKAMSKSLEVAERTQQTGLLGKMSDLRRSGTWGKVMTFALSAPEAQYNNSISTLRAMGAFGDPKRIPAGRGLRRMLVYTILIPMTLQFIADGFEWEPRRQAAAIGSSLLTLGASNYPLFLGQLPVAISRELAGLPTFELGQSAPGSILNELKDSVGSVRDALTEAEGITTEEFYKALQDLGVALATARGYPAKSTERIIEGWRSYDIHQDPRRLGGWSEFALEPQGEEKDRILSEEEIVEKVKQFNRMMEEGEMTAEERNRKVDSLRRKQEQLRAEKLYNQMRDVPNEESFELYDEQSEGIQEELDKLAEDEAERTAKEVFERAKDISDNEAVELYESQSELVQEKMDELQENENKKQEILENFGHGDNPIDAERKSERTILEGIKDYAEAIGTDPIEAFNKIRRGHIIEKTEEDAIIVYRADFEYTQAIRELREASEKQELDHVVPLWLGGTNDADNLQLVDEEEHQRFTEFGNRLRQLHRGGQISQEKAKEIITALKEGEIDESEANQRIRRATGG